MTSARDVDPVDQNVSDETNQPSSVDLQSLLKLYHSELVQRMDIHFERQEKLLTALAPFGELLQNLGSTDEVHKALETKINNQNRRQVSGETNASRKISQDSGFLVLPGAIDDVTNCTNSEPSMPMRQQTKKDANLKKIVQANKQKKNLNQKTGILRKANTEVLTSRQTRLCVRIVSSQAFDLCSLLLISAFCIYMIIPLMSLQTCPQSGKMEYLVVDTTFCALFVVELGIRFLAYGCKLFWSADWAWNLFDLVVVLFSVVETVVSLTTSSNTLNPMIFRVLRLARTARSLRLAKVLRLNRELRMIMLSIAGSLKSLGWSLLMLFLFICLVSCALTSAAQSCAMDATSGDAEILRKRFGTLLRCCRTLFMSISGGMDWGDVYDDIEPLGWHYQTLYVVYVSFTIFGLINVIAAVFVENAMEASQQDRDFLIRNSMQQQEQSLSTMVDFFQELDANQSGKLTLEEFELHLDDERAFAYFETLKLDVSDVERLFRLLDTDQSGSIDIEEFVDGCQKLKGESRSLDIKIALLELRQLQEGLATFSQQVSTQLAELLGRDLR